MGSRSRGLGHGPHVHDNVPAGLHEKRPSLREHNFAVRVDEIVVAFLDVGTDDVDVEESLFDEFFHAL